MGPRPHSQLRSRNMLNPPMTLVRQAVLALRENADTLELPIPTTWMTRPSSHLLRMKNARRQAIMLAHMMVVGKPPLRRALRGDTKPLRLEHNPVIRTSRTHVIIGANLPKLLNLLLRSPIPQDARTLLPGHTKKVNRANLAIGLMHLPLQRCLNTRIHPQAPMQILRPMLHPLVSLLLAFQCPLHPPPCQGERDALNLPARTCIDD